MTDKILIDRSLLQQALDALDTVSLELGIDWLRPEFADAGSTATALRAALAAPQRQPLTQPEKQRLWNDAMHGNRSSTTDAAMDFGSAIETAHGITKDPAA